MRDYPLYAGQADRQTAGRGLRLTGRVAPADRHEQNRQSSKRGGRDPAKDLGRGWDRRGCLGFVHSRLGARHGDEIRRTRNGHYPERTQPSEKGSARIPHGLRPVWNSRFRGTAPARMNGSIVTFEPGARTAWHTHPLGQTLIVTSGLGWVQVEGGPKEEVRPGDVVVFAPGEKHWHGASPATAMRPHRNLGIARRQERRLDGAGHRRAISGLRTLDADTARPRTDHAISSRSRGALRYDEPLPTLRLLPSALRGAAPAASGSGCRADPHQQRRHGVRADSGGHVPDRAPTESRPARRAASERPRHPGHGHREALP